MVRSPPRWRRPGRSGAPRGGERPDRSSGPPMSGRARGPSSSGSGRVQCERPLPHAPVRRRLLREAWESGARFPAVAATDGRGGRGRARTDRCPGAAPAPSAASSIPATPTGGRPIRWLKNLRRSPAPARLRSKDASHSVQARGHACGASCSSRWSCSKNWPRTFRGHGSTWCATTTCSRPRRARVAFPLASPGGRPWRAAGGSTGGREPDSREPNNRCERCAAGRSPLGVGRSDAPATAARAHRPSRWDPRTRR